MKCNLCRELDRRRSANAGRGGIAQRRPAIFNNELEIFSQKNKLPRSRILRFDNRQPVRDSANHVAKSLPRGAE